MRAYRRTVSYNLVPDTARQNRPSHHKHHKDIPTPSIVGRAPDYILYNLIFISFDRRQIEALFLDGLTLAGGMVNARLTFRGSECCIIF